MFLPLAKYIHIYPEDSGVEAVRWSCKTNVLFRHALLAGSASQDASRRFQVDLQPMLFGHAKLVIVPTRIGIRVGVWFSLTILLEEGHKLWLESRGCPVRRQAE